MSATPATRSPVATIGGREAMLAADLASVLAAADRLLRGPLEEQD